MVSDVIKEIDAIVGRINVHPEYSQSLRSKLVGDLRDEANRRSSQIESDENSVPNPFNKKVAHDCLERLEKARELLSREGVDAYTLSKLGNIVEPNKNPSPIFRRTELRFAGFAPPGPSEIGDLIQGLLLDLEDCSIHSVTRAIGSHIGVVQIHPYVDGNGRIARLLENYVLERSSYPPVSIPVSERPLYFALMRGALGDRYKNESSLLAPTDRELLFHNFIESKVLTAAEYLEERLRSRRVYDVEIYGLKGKGVGYKMKNCLGAHIRTIPGNEDARVNSLRIRGKELTLTVAGNISEQDLSNYLGKCAKKGGFRYSIASRKSC